MGRKTYFNANEVFLSPCLPSLPPGGPVAHFVSTLELANISGCLAISVLKQ